MEIERLRTFESPQSQYLWDAVPFDQRAAVLIILYRNARQQLSVILTVRALKMRTYPGQAAFPGGRCDSQNETPWDTALREANEEIGFDEANFKFQKLCILPCYLSRHYVVVRPCVCLIEPLDPSTAHLSLDQVVTGMNEEEVSIVYSIDFESFLHSDTSFLTSYALTEWAGRPWVYYEYEAARNDKSEWVFQDPSSELAETYSSNAITGLTAHMALDCARIAHNRTPDGMDFLADLGYDQAVGDQLKVGKFEKKRI